MSTFARISIFLAALSVVALTGRARAELRELAGRVADQWRQAGAEVVQLPPRFLHDDETVTVGLPPPSRGAAAECTTVVLLGARGMSFRATLDSGSDDDDVARAQSVAGALSLMQCGKGAVRRLMMTSDAGRGAIEIIVGRSRGPLAPLRVVLPERTGGTLSFSAEPGDLPPLLPPEKRAETAEARARREGATIAARNTWTAGPDGTGAGRLTLEPGCHRLELFAVDPHTPRAGRRGKLDLDAELRDDEDDRLLARDRTDAPDAHLDTCTGEVKQVVVIFAGSPVHAPVIATHATWPLPEMLPWTWGAEVRARMASALIARHVNPPSSKPVMLAQGGGAGTTPVPIAVEPGGCYIAVAATVQGTGKGIGVRAVVAARDASDDRGVEDEAGAVAFCALTERRARIDVDVRGTLAWALAVYRIQSRVWEISR